MKTNLEIYHDKDDQMWYVYDKTDDNHEYIFDYFSDVSCWVKEFYEDRGQKFTRKAMQKALSLEN
jgi:hypothetical protein